MKLLILLIVFFTSGNTIAETSNYVLTKNPFIKPGFVTINDINKKEEEPKFSLTDNSLRATLSAGDGSIANVNGQMLFIGDNVSGYELTSVGIGSATFVRNGKEITLNVSEMHKKLK